MKKKILSAIAVALAAITFSGCSFFGQQSTNAMGSYDFSAMDLIQLKEPVEGQDVVIIETTEGTMTAVLYSEYAPNTIANFKARIEEGFYNNKPFFAIQKGVYGMTGASNAEGTEGVTDDGKYIPNECSVNLWPFKGALLGYSSQMGYSDSRFYFSGAIELSEEDLKELRGYTEEETGEQAIPEKLIQAFIDRGSVPGLAATYTVFGQVINGFDTLDKILWTESDNKTLKPSKEILITKMTLDTYEKGKFELEEPTADKFLTKEEADKLLEELDSGSADSSVNDKIKLDDYTGAKLDDVKKSLEEKGIKYEIYKQNHDNVEADLVIRTEPAADTEVEKGSTVKIYVSLGKK